VGAFKGKERAMDQNEKRLYEILEELNIADYELHEHVALFSAKQEEAEDCMFPGLNLKNLLMKDKKSGHFFMIILEDHRRMDSKHFKKVTGWSKTKFATEEEMWELLKLTPGSVTPYALFNDVDNQITVVLGNEIVVADDETNLNFHPCRNTATISIKKKDFLRIMKYMGNTMILEEETE
jgi:Ala-tRNA(Pro) deacylase